MKKMKIFTMMLLGIAISTFIKCVGVKSNFSNDLVIELKTTECSGTCPAFTLQIFSNGDMILDGKKHLKQIGKFKSKLNKKDLEKIISLFEDIKFFELNN